MIMEINRLDKLDFCLFCGASRSEKKLEHEHVFPRSMAKKPDSIKKSKHPFKRVVYDNLTNVFIVCEKEHKDIDSRKAMAFSRDGFTTLNPIGLITFLMEEYPLTSNMRYYDLQLKNMIATNGRFIDTVKNLNGELPKDLVTRYQDAISAAEKFSEKLEGLLTVN